MDKLTLDHLAPYIPYGVKILTGPSFIRELVVDLPSGSAIRTHVPLSYILTGIGHKPILHPLSDLTKEIEHNGDRFTPNNRIDQYTQIGGDGKLYLLVDGALWSCNPLSWDYYLVVKLISWHFDVFGLIEKGLAIDFNTVKGGHNEI